MVGGMDFADVEKMRLEPWGEGGFWLPRRANSPEMTVHSGSTPHPVSQTVPPRHSRAQVDLQSIRRPG